MSQPYSWRPAQEHTVTAVEGAATPPARPRCKVALMPGSAQLSQELVCLLRRRLRIAGLIALAAFVFILIRQVWLTDDDPVFTRDILPFHLGVIAVLMLCSALLWSHLSLSMRSLRWIEVACFGVMAVFFGYLQVLLFDRDVI